LKGRKGGKEAGLVPAEGGFVDAAAARSWETGGERAAAAAASAQSLTAKTSAFTMVATVQ